MAPTYPGMILQVASSQSSGRYGQSGRCWPCRIHRWGTTFLQGPGGRGGFFKGWPTLPFRGPGSPKLKMVMGLMDSKYLAFRSWSYTPTAHLLTFDEPGSDPQAETVGCSKNFGAWTRSYSYDMYMKHVRPGPRLPNIGTWIEGAGEREREYMKHGSRICMASYPAAIFFQLCWLEVWFKFCVLGTCLAHWWDGNIYASISPSKCGHVAPVM